MSVIENSSLKTWKIPFIVLLAPPKEGKTTVCATLSKFWPGTLPSKEPVHLSDLVYLAFDRGGLDGFQSLNLTTNVVDFSAIESHAEREQLRVQATEEMKAMRKKGELSGIIVDTASALDAQLVAHFGAKNEFKPQLYQEVGSYVSRLFFGLAAIGCPVVFNTHVKAVNIDFMKDDARAEAQKRLALTAMETGDVGGPKATPDVCASTLKFLRTQSSGTIALQKEMVKNKPTEWWFYTRNWQGYELGNRAPNWADKEPANLSALIEKARAGVRK